MAGSASETRAIAWPHPRRHGGGGKPHLLLDCGFQRRPAHTHADGSSEQTSKTGRKRPRDRAHTPSQRGRRRGRARTTPGGGGEGLQRPPSRLSAAPAADGTHAQGTDSRVCELLQQLRRDGVLKRRHVGVRPATAKSKTAQPWSKTSLIKRSFDLLLSDQTRVVGSTPAVVFSIFFVGCPRIGFRGRI